jgi:hypothetical protein
MDSKNRNLADRRLAQALLAVFAMVAVAGVVQSNPGPLHDLMPDGVPALVIVLGSLGALFLGIFAVQDRALSQARQWPTVTGTVVDSRVIDARDHGRPRSAARTYRPHVVVAYSVDGVDYRTDQLYLGAVVGGSKPFAEREIAPYPKGSSAIVRYNPAAPGEAAIHITMGLGWLLGGMGGLLLVGAGLATGLFI